MPRSARACADAEERVLPRAVLRWLACHQPGQVARIEAALPHEALPHEALPHEALPHVWHVRARLSSSASYHLVVFIPTAARVSAHARTGCSGTMKRAPQPAQTGFVASADAFRRGFDRRPIPAERPLQSIRWHATLVVSGHGRVSNRAAEWQRGHRRM